MVTNNSESYLRNYFKTVFFFPPPRFLPPQARQALDKALRDCGIHAQQAADDVDVERALSCKKTFLSFLEKLKNY